MAVLPGHPRNGSCPVHMGSWCSFDRPLVQQFQFECHFEYLLTKLGHAEQALLLRDVGPIAASQGADGSVFMAIVGDGSIRRLAPMPYDQQARSLAAAEEFAEALSMAALLPDHQVCSSESVCMCLQQCERFHVQIQVHALSVMRWCVLRR